MGQALRRRRHLLHRRTSQNPVIYASSFRSFKGGQEVRKGASGYGGQAICDKGIVSLGKYDGYEPLANEIAKFFRTNTPPVTAEESLEIYTFMAAAQLSKERNAPVTMKEVLEDAQAKATNRWKP